MPWGGGGGVVAEGGWDAQGGWVHSHTRGLPPLGHYRAYGPIRLWDLGETCDAKYLQEHSGEFWFGFK